MNKDVSIKKPDNSEDTVNVPGPAPYEEELKDYSKKGEEEEDLIDNLPDSHPEPSPTKEKDN